MSANFDSAVACNLKIKHKVKHMLPVQYVTFLVTARNSMLKLNSVNNAWSFKWVNDSSVIVLCTSMLISRGSNSQSKPGLTA